MTRSLIELESAAGGSAVRSVFHIPGYVGCSVPPDKISLHQGNGYSVRVQEAETEHDLQPVRPHGIMPLVGRILVASNDGRGHHATSP